MTAQKCSVYLKRLKLNIY